MKRDMDLIRKMLFAMEANEHGFVDKLEIKGYTEEEIGFHAYLLGQAGLANVIDVTSFASKSPEAMVRSLTQAGYDFVEAARDDNTWNKAKGIMSKAGEFAVKEFFKVLVEVAMKNMGGKV